MAEAVSIRIEGDKEVKRALDSLLKETRDLRPAWDRFYRPHFHKGMEMAFQRKQDGTWRPLKADYAAWKAKHGGGDLMVLTGALRSSLTSETGESVYTKGEREMTVGSTNIPTNTPRGRMVIWSGNSALKYEINEAAKEHVAWYADKWAGRAV